MQRVYQEYGGEVRFHRGEHQGRSSRGGGVRRGTRCDVSAVIDQDSRQGFAVLTDTAPGHGLSPGGWRRGNRRPVDPVLGRAANRLPAGLPPGGLVARALELARPVTGTARLRRLPRPSVWRAHAEQAW